MNLLKELLDIKKQPAIAEAEEKKGGLNKTIMEAKVPTISSIDFAKLVIPPKVPTELMDIIRNWKNDVDLGDVSYVKKSGRKNFLVSLDSLPSLQKTKKQITAINNIDKIIFTVDWKDAEPRTKIGPLKRHLANQGYALIDFNEKGIILHKVKNVEKDEPKKDEKKADAPKAEPKKEVKKDEPKAAPKKAEVKAPEPKKVEAPKPAKKDAPAKK